MLMELNDVTVVRPLSECASVLTKSFVVLLADAELIAILEEIPPDAVAGESLSGVLLSIEVRELSPSVDVLMSGLPDAAVLELISDARVDV